MSNIYTNYFNGKPISDDWNKHIKRGSLGGTDYAVSVGTPIHAPTNGKVTNISYNGTGGHTVNLVSPNGYKTQFMHCSRFVNAGSYNQGDIIGYTGGAKGSDGAGSSTGPHCHIHIVLPNGARVNMLDYVNKDFSGNVSTNNGWKNIQSGIARTNGYTGLIDGIAGPNTWKALQKFLRNYGYTGPIDGIPGLNTYKAFQRWLAASYGYNGVIDGILGNLSKASINRI
jgi:murein DD-endopeptidase MepM/ murein hydrolase activator NlpD